MPRMSKRLIIAAYVIFLCFVLSIAMPIPFFSIEGGGGIATNSQRNIILSLEIFASILFIVYITMFMAKEKEQKSIIEEEMERAKRLLKRKCQYLKKEKDEARELSQGLKEAVPSDEALAGKGLSGIGLIIGVVVASLMSGPLTPLALIVELIALGAIGGVDLWALWFEIQDIIPALKNLQKANRRLAVGLAYLDDSDVFLPGPISSDETPEEKRERWERQIEERQKKRQEDWDNMSEDKKKKWEEENREEVEGELDPIPEVLKIRDRLNLLM